MFTKTTAIASPHFPDDIIILNNEEGSSENQRFRNCLAEGKAFINWELHLFYEHFLVRKLAEMSSNVNTVEMSRWKIKIVSDNNFPTKAGLASSASGYACLGKRVFSPIYYNKK